MKTKISNKVSIKDIAEVAGVSHTTVSRALRNSAIINIKTRNRIHEIAASMGYIPDAIAQSLQTGQTRTIGFVITTLADPFFARLVEGIEEVAASAGFSIFINVSNNSPDQEIQVIEIFQRRRVDAIIVAASRLGERQLNRLIHIQTPVVFINQQTQLDCPNSFHFINVDEEEGAFLAISHLLQLGHTRIGYLGLGSHFQSNLHRLEGYKNTLQAVGIPIQPGYIQVIPADKADLQGDIAAGQEAFPSLYHQGISAIFCYNDRAAIGCLQAARQMGVSIPQQCSLIGFDDIDMAKYVSPSLTTISQRQFEMGRQCMHNVLDLLAHKTVNNIEIHPTLIQRESTIKFLER